MHKVERFGDFIKGKRLSQSPKITLREMSERLGINLTLLSDIENNRKKPFDEEYIRKFCEELHLSKEDEIKMFDLAAVERNTVPQDIAEDIMYSTAGDYARQALRATTQSEADIAAWDRLLKELENNKEKR